jgi:type III secretory pathway lipoprotein EscJ
MRRVLSCLFFCLMLHIQTSCKKCISCTITDSNGNEIAIDERTCGNRQQREDARTEAEIRGENLGGSANCNDVD